MAKQIGITAIQVSIKTVDLSKNILKQMPAIEQFTREFLPGGKEAQNEDYCIVGWVHGSVLEAAEDYWCWLLVMLERGEYRRMRVSKDDIVWWGARYDWMKDVKQLYL